MQRIKEDIKTGQLNQIYLLYGPEAYLRRQYRDNLSNALRTEGDTMNYHYFEGKDVNVGEVIDLAETMPFFADRRVIILENSGLFKGDGDRLAEYLAEPAPAAHFVFVEAEIDKRSKLYKTIKDKGYVALFDSMDERSLKIWIGNRLKKENFKITESTVEYFLSKTGTDMENICGELEKVICYCMGRDVITAEDVDAICTTRMSNHIFDMIEAIAEKKQKKALELYYELLALKEPPLRILFLIARHCNQLLQVKELKSKGFDNKAIGSKLSIPPFAVGKIAGQAGRFKTSDLKAAVTKCVEAEEAVKSGRLNDVMSVEMLILSVL